MKKLIASLLLGTALTLGALSAGAAEPSAAVMLTPDDNGGAAVRVELPDSKGITSMRLRLQVQTTLGEADAAAATFDFDDALPGRVRQSRYNPETGTLTLYVSGREALFTDGALELGTISLTSTQEEGATAAVTAEEGCLRILNASYGGEKAPSPDLPADPVEITAGNGGKAPAPAVDKTRLEAALELAHAKQEGDYTPESWVRFRQVLRYAERVYGSVDATQQELDEALTQLNAALDQLTPVTPNPEQTPNPAPTQPPQSNPKPSATPKPTQTPGATQKPTASPAPSASPAPTAAPGQTPAATPNSGSGSVEVTTPTQAPQGGSGNSDSNSGSQQPTATQAPVTSVIGSVKNWLSGKKPAATAAPSATPSASAQPSASPAPTRAPAASVETAQTPSPSPVADAQQTQTESQNQGISPVIWVAIVAVAAALVGVAIWLIRRQR